MERDTGKAATAAGATQGLNGAAGSRGGRSMERGTKIHRCPRPSPEGDFNANKTSCRPWGSGSAPPDVPRNQDRVKKPAPMRHSSSRQDGPILIDSPPRVTTRREEKRRYPADPSWVNSSKAVAVEQTDSSAGSQPIDNSPGDTFSDLGDKFFEGVQSHTQRMGVLLVPPRLSSTDFFSAQAEKWHDYNHAASQSPASCICGGVIVKEEGEATSNLVGDTAHVDLMCNRAPKLEMEITKRLDKLKSAAPRLLLTLVRSIDDAPPSLTLPTDGFVMDRHAATVHRDLYELQELLKKEPRFNQEIIVALRITTASWRANYADPRPGDLVKLISDLEDLEKLLSSPPNQLSFEGKLTASAEREAVLLFQQYESACAEASDELKLFAGDKVNIQAHRRHLEACHTDWLSRAEYHERKARAARANSEAYLGLLKRNQDIIDGHSAAVHALAKKISDMEDGRDQARAAVEDAKRKKEDWALAPPPIVSRVLSYPCNPYFGITPPPQ
uniref:Uncharacterized protein n=1 Tax=Leersia perrieri TaxID=77586 RepID=A0A0D9XCF7_9ORYZ